MREIKFRAWDADNKMMWNIWKVNCGYNGRAVPERLYALDFDKMESVKKEDMILMQFTGLKDKNGKEIYEGDIIKITRHSLEIDPVTRHTIERYPDGDVIPVKWINAQMAYNVRPDYILNSETYEVIGNIYENPELLK